LGGCEKRSLNVTANTGRLASLEQILDPGQIKSDPETLSSYAVDGVLPWAVVFPQETEQVSEVVRLASKEKWGLVPWGSGSKISMGNPPARLDLVVCTTQLNKIIDMDTANLTVTVQAGVKFRHVQSSLASEENRCYIPLEDPVTLSSEGPVCSDRENTGCFVPMAPPYSDSATFGGTVATNAGGPKRLLYGMPRDIVLGVRYVAPSGNIIGMGGKTVKNVSGYDMCKLMIGSMGSLGILCEMTLRLLPLPERLTTSLSTFSTLSEASRFVDRIFESPLLPAAVEITNSRAYELLAPEEPARLEGNGYAVVVALEGAQEAVGRMESEIAEMALASGAKENIDLQEQAHLQFWDAYSNLVPRSSGKYPDPVSFRLNYAISNYVEVLELIDSLASDNQLDHMLLAHAGCGVSFVHFSAEPNDLKAADGIALVAEKLAERCRSIGGNLVLERANPDLKKRLPVWGLSRDDLIVMKRIKEEMDPSGICCPGRFVGGI
jgi:FAD/FMN-containing dehydrogenase